MCVRVETAISPGQAIKVFHLNQEEPLIEQKKPSPKAVCLGVEDAYFRNRFRNREAGSEGPNWRQRILKGLGGLFRPDV